jgi:hypothetical protein
VSKKELKAKIEALEQRVAVLEAQNAPLIPTVTRTEPYMRWNPGPTCVSKIDDNPSNWVETTVYGDGDDRRTYEHILTGQKRTDYLRSGISEYQ